MSVWCAGISFVDVTRTPDKINRGGCTWKIVAPPHYPPAKCFQTRRLKNSQSYFLIRWLQWLVPSMPFLLLSTPKYSKCSTDLASYEGLTPRFVQYLNGNGFSSSIFDRRKMRYFTRMPSQ